MLTKQTPTASETKAFRETKQQKKLDLDEIVKCKISSKKNSIK
jgi:hypothetical protein